MKKKFEFLKRVIQENVTSNENLGNECQKFLLELKQSLVLLQKEQSREKKKTIAEDIAKRLLFLTDVLESWIEDK